MNLEEKTDNEVRRYMDTLSEGLTYDKKDMERAFRWGFTRGMQITAQFMIEK